MGEQTFGKGVVQYYFPINNDGGVKLTVAKYLTPHRCDAPTPPSARLPGPYGFAKSHVAVPLYLIAPVVEPEFRTSTTARLLTGQPS